MTFTREKGKRWPRSPGNKGARVMSLSVPYEENGDLTDLEQLSPEERRAVIREEAARYAQRTLGRLLETARPNTQVLGAKDVVLANGLGLTVQQALASLRYLETRRTGSAEEADRRLRDYENEFSTQWREASNLAWEAAQAQQRYVRRVAEREGRLLQLNGLRLIYRKLVPADQTRADLVSLLAKVADPTDLNQINQAVSDLSAKIKELEEQTIGARAELVRLHKESVLPEDRLIEKILHDMIKAFNPTLATPEATEVTHATIARELEKVTAAVAEAMAKATADDLRLWQNTHARAEAAARNRPSSRLPAALAAALDALYKADYPVIWAVYQDQCSAVPGRAVVTDALLNVASYMLMDTAGLSKRFAEAQDPEGAVLAFCAEVRRRIAPYAPAQATTKSRIVSFFQRSRGPQSTSHERVVSATPRIVRMPAQLAGTEMVPVEEVTGTVPAGSVTTGVPVGSVTAGVPVGSATARVPVGSVTVQPTGSRPGYRSRVRPPSGPPSILYVDAI